MEDVLASPRAFFLEIQPDAERRICCSSSQPSTSEVRFVARIVRRSRSGSSSRGVRSGVHREPSWLAVFITTNDEAANSGWWRRRWRSVEAGVDELLPHRPA